MPDLILHVGIHRTGSTSVQNALAASRQDLLLQGVLYPRTGTTMNVHHGLCFAIMGKPSTPWGPLPSLDQLLSNLRTEIRASGCHTVLISSEEFRRLSHEEDPLVAERTRQFLSLFAHVRVVCFLRHQIPLLDSGYRIGVRWQAQALALDFRPWIQRNCAGSWHDYRRIERFFRQLSPGATFDFLSFAAATKSGALVKYFYEHIGILNAYSGEMRNNESPSRLSILAVLLTNQGRLSLKVSRDEFMLWADSVFPNGHESLFDDELLHSVDNLFRTDNDMLAERTGFNLNDELTPYLAEHQLAGSSLTLAEQSMLRTLLARNGIAVPDARFQAPSLPDCR